ncbi:MAG: glycine--tRNA ligase subunit beta [Rickettsiaceae bacterium]|nr:glycine--tRNA ligase subunit beta [Rickettsiaceae bacterium]
MSELLIELYCEEIPANMQKKAEISYLDIFTKYFKELEITYNQIKVFIGSCRLTIHIDGLPKIIAAKEIELKGPRVNAPETAIKGFCKSNNVEQQQLQVKTTKGQEFLTYIQNIPAKDIKDILQETLTTALFSYVWPKSMSWGDYDIRWVRPLKNILCIFDNEIITIKYGHLTANNISFGHKFMHTEPFEVSGFTDYQQNLLKNQVILDRQTRINMIKNDLEKATTKLGAVLKEDQYLLEEVAGLNEYPIVLTGKINEKFLKLPSEMLVTSMRSHQKYFSLFNKDGSFAPYFLFCTNINSNDLDIIIYGNEKVLSARLSDALYFYNQDLKLDFKTSNNDLEKVIFHDKIGTMLDKVKLLSKFCGYLNQADNAALVAASICKNDIVSEAVGEFPSLQGVMGYYYARAAGHTEEVATAIKDHYKPQGANDLVPIASSATLALADKFYDLCSLMLIGEKPTGSKDPYALRRHALGIIRIILTNRLNINLKEFLKLACQELALDSQELALDNTITITKNDILSFIEERAKYYFKDYYSHDLINATLDLELEPDLHLTSLKLAALKEFIENDAASNDLLSSYKRINNILDNQQISGEIKQDLLQDKSEKDLFNFINLNIASLEEFLYKKDYKSILDLLANMKSPITEFFDNVMVKDEDPAICNNRLLLLNQVRLMFNKIAKFDLL